MKRMKRLLLGIGCALLLAVSWLAALTAESDAQRQAKLIEQAAAYTQDEIYVRAIPLLEEATGYDDKYTLEAEEALKDAYLNMMDQSGYARKYTNLLEKQMARKDAAPEMTLPATREAHALPISRPEAPSRSTVAPIPDNCSKICTPALTGERLTAEKYP